MQLTVELVTGAVAIVAILLGLLVWRRRAGRLSAAKGAAVRGPTNMYFTCAGCSGQFAHTKRTVAAWEKGSRRAFCDACHKKWRNVQPPQTQSTRANVAAPARATVGRGEPARATIPSYSSEVKSPGGCLGVVLLMLLVPFLAMVLVINA